MNRIDERTRRERIIKSGLALAGSSVNAVAKEIGFSYSHVLRVVRGDFRHPAIERYIQGKICQGKALLV